MFFTLTDVILIVLVMFFLIGGFMMGLIQAIGALIGVVVGAWAAGQYYLPFADWLTPYLLGHESAAKIIAFILIFIIINRVISIIFWIINKVFKIASIIPFLSSINRFAGAILGFIEGVLIVGLVVYVTAKLGGNIGWLIDGLNSSRIAHLLVSATSFMTGLLSQGITNMSSIF